MVRLIASLLLALFSVSLASPLWAEDETTKLPACCRRLGKHACSISGSHRAAGAGFENGRCPAFPGTATSLIKTKFAGTRLATAMAPDTLGVQAYVDAATVVPAVTRNHEHERGPPTVSFLS